MTFSRYSTRQAGIRCLVETVVAISSSICKSYLQPQMTTQQPSRSPCDEHASDTLRQQSESLNALERKVAVLEQQKLELQRDLDRLHAELGEHRRARDEWDWLFEHAVDMMLIHDEQGNVARASPSVEKILGFTPAELIEQGATGVVHPDDLSKTMAHLDNVARGRDGVNFVTRCRHKNGEWRWIAWTTPAPKYTAGEKVRSYSIGRDITMSKLSEEQLLYRAEHDALTGLANRARFDRAVEHALALAERSKRRVGLLLVDLDGFKAINDLHGHQTGDEVLKAGCGTLRLGQPQGRPSRASRWRRIRLPDGRCRQNYVGCGSRTHAGDSSETRPVGRVATCSRLQHRHSLLARQRKQRPRPVQICRQSALSGQKRGQMRFRVLHARPGCCRAARRAMRAARPRVMPPGLRTAGPPSIPLTPVTAVAHGALP